LGRSARRTNFVVPIRLPMRALKTILIILLALLAILVVLGLTGPAQYRVERSIVLAGPPEPIYEQVRLLANQRDWGPWQALEKDQVRSIEGVDGTVGAVWKWSGDTVGTGRQEILALEPGRSVRTRLVFSFPVIGDMESGAAFTLEPQGDSTRVVWVMEGTNGFVGRIMGVFRDMDANLGPMFEQGLRNLGMRMQERAAVEAPVQQATLQVVAGERAPQLYLGIRKRVKWSELKTFFGSSFGQAMGIIQQAGVQPAGPPSAVYFEWDTLRQEADLLAGIPVAAGAKSKLKGMTLYEAPGGKTLQVAYRGGYNGIGAAHDAIDAQCSADGLTINVNVIEEYVTDPGLQPDSTQWLTNVIYLVDQAAPGATR
jgi:effector-binding domain-containing protein